MRISDWSSDVCSSDLLGYSIGAHARPKHHPSRRLRPVARHAPVRIAQAADAVGMAFDRETETAAKQLVRHGCQGGAGVWIQLCGPLTKHWAVGAVHKRNPDTIPLGRYADLVPELTCFGRLGDRKSVV